MSVVSALTDCFNFVAKAVNDSRMPGVIFNSVTGNPPGNPAGSFAVGIASSSPIPFTASVLPGAAWLSVTKAAATANSSAAGLVTFAIDPVVSASLAPQAYYGTTAPGVLTFVSGETIAQHQAGGYVSDDSPAIPGEYLVFYVAGMGPLNVPVPSGGGAPGLIGDSPATTLNTPVLTLDNNPVNLTFSGLTPGAVGLIR